MGADVSKCKLPAVSGVSLSTGFGFQSGTAPSTGTLTSFMIFVDFPDAPATSSWTPQAVHDVFVPGGPDWYRNSSFGKLDLTVNSDTSHFVRMPAASTSYNFQRSLTYDLHKKYIQDAVKAYGKTIEPVDVLYIAATPQASAISFSPTFSDKITTTSGTVIAKRGVTFGEDAYTSWHYKVLNHETGHAMGLPDYYPLAGGPTDQYVGGWSVMGDINGPSPDNFGWDKWRLGWLSDSQVQCVAGSGSTTHTLSPIEVASTDAPKLLVVRVNATSAVVAEVRSNLGNDNAACDTGVLLYQIWTDRPTGSAPLVVLDANPGTTGCDNQPLNDATLTFGGKGASSYTVQGVGVKVTVTGQSGNDYTFRVDKS